MRYKKSIQAVVSATLVVSLAGCASILDPGPRRITVKSEPSDAKVTVFDRTWQAVDTQQTPAILHLERGDGYFEGANYHLVIEKDGYQKYKIDVKSSIEGLYFANIILGGLVGMLIVDPITGSMYTLTPTDISVVLNKQSAGIKLEKGSIYVMLRQDLPDEFASRLIPVQGR